MVFDSLGRYLGHHEQCLEMDLSHLERCKERVIYMFCGLAAAKVMRRNEKLINASAWGLYTATSSAGRTTI